MSSRPAVDADGPSIQTRLAAPWALVRSGRPVPGRRAPTRMGFLTQAITSNGELRAYRYVPLSRDGRPAAVPPRRVEPRDVVATFCVRPTEHAVDRARRRLRPLGGRGAGA